MEQSGFLKVIGPKGLHLYVAKNKNGRTGEVWMQWDSPTATYRQLARRGL